MTIAIMVVEGVAIKCSRFGNGSRGSKIMEVGVKHGMIKCW